MEFIVEMIACRFLHHSKVIVMDNAAIHSGGESTILEDILWNTVIDDKPLRIFLLPLPTRAPELNPIELIFHILARRVASFKYTSGLSGNGFWIQGNAVSTVAEKVLNDLSFDLIKRTVAHCGYSV